MARADSEDDGKVKFDDFQKSLIGLTMLVEKTLAEQKDLLASVTKIDSFKKDVEKKLTAFLSENELSDYFDKVTDMLNA